MEFLYLFKYLKSRAEQSYKKANSYSIHSAKIKKTGKQ